MESIRVLVQNGARPLQPSYVVQWGSLQSGEPAIEIVEKPNVAWLAELFITGELELTAQVFKQLKMSGTDLGLPIETRVQKLQQPHPNSTKTTQFVDVWECIEKEVERISTPANLPNAKVNLKKIHTAYNTDKLEALYKKPKKGKKSKSNTAASEQS
ncbi:unnamed protein product [Mesocestoides corti]|nr:unnamed protein product [Mesocestoides corti]